MSMEEAGVGAAWMCVAIALQWPLHMCRNAQCKQGDALATTLALCFCLVVAQARLAKLGRSFHVPTKHLQARDVGVGG